MTLFKSQTHQEIWLDRWCHTCYQPDEAMRRIMGADTQCPIQKRALETGRKPVKWERNARAHDMENAIRCHEYLDKPRTTRKTKALDANQDSLFDVEPREIHLVPVPGWPDYTQARWRRLDHA